MCYFILQSLTPILHYNNPLTGFIATPTFYEIIFLFATLFVTLFATFFAEFMISAPNDKFKLVELL